MNTGAPFVSFYSNEDIKKAKSYLKTQKPIITLDQIKELKLKFSDPKYSIIILGNCSESIHDTEQNFYNELNLISAVENLYNANKKQTINIIRGAGQCFKYRSSLYETLNNNSLILNYFGDGINNISNKNRTPDIDRLFNVYNFALKKVNYMHNKKTDLYFAHECLFIPYEEGLLRKNEQDLYLSSAHMPWIGYKTLNYESSIIDFLSNIENPIGIKVGPNTNLRFLSDVIKRLNSKHELGKIVLILRFGAKNLYALQTALDVISTFQPKCSLVIDPCHGNTEIFDKIKTRKLDSMIKESAHYFSYADNCNIMLESANESIKECIDDKNKTIDQSMYKTLCDPRLSLEQVLNLLDKSFFSK
jgi:3-deoxy-D-arabino-heptulosonate 7-phosphate (DAHP) synthase class II